MSGNDHRIDARADFGFWAIVVLVVIVAGWLLLMPMTPAIARWTMQRFHLTSSSYMGFAIQAPIPAMYNFANRWKVTDAPDQWGVSQQTPSMRHINHFPARVFTFGSGIERHLRDAKDRWFQLESHYRGQTLTTGYHLKPASGGGYKVIRLETP